MARETILPDSERKGPSGQVGAPPRPPAVPLMSTGPLVTPEEQKLIKAMTAPPYKC